jgi:hypothetical protein
MSSTLTLAVAESEQGQARLRESTGVLGYNRESRQIVVLWISQGEQTSSTDVVTILVNDSDELQRAIVAVERSR